MFERGLDVWYGSSKSNFTGNKHPAKELLKKTASEMFSSEFFKIFSYFQDIAWLILNIDNPSKTLSTLSSKKDKTTPH